MKSNRVGRGSSTQATKFAAVMVLLIAGFNFAGLHLLLSRGEVSRIITIEDVDDPSIGRLGPRGSAVEQKAFLRMLRDAGLDKLQGEKQVLMLLQWVMNSVRRIEPEERGSPYRILMES